ncbi:MAG: hypothetical protein M5U27_14370 [Gaiella sp.]|nr:hypothetical protein [Gaiella sp.]
MERVAEREVVLLHADDVREVGPEVELERERERCAGLVAQHDVVLEAVPHEAVTRDREDVQVEAVAGRVAGIERGGEVLDLAR